MRSGLRSRGLDADDKSVKVGDDCKAEGQEIEDRKIAGAKPSPGTDEREECSDFSMLLRMGLILARKGLRDGVAWYIYA